MFAIRPFRAVTFFVVSLGLCLLATGAVELQSIVLRARVENDQARAIRERQDELKQVAEGAFSERLEQLIGMATAVSRDPLVVGTTSNDPHLFQRLAELQRSSGLSIEIVDSSGVLLAWAGLSARPDGFNPIPPQQGLFAVVTRNGLFTFLTAGVRTGAPDRMILVSAPLETDLPAENRLVRRASFADALSERTGARASLDARPDTVLREMDGQFKVLLRGPKHEPLAAVIFPVPTVESIQQDILESAAWWRRVTVAAALFFAGGLGWHVVSRLPRRGTRAFVRLLLVWSVRLGWLAIGFPAGVIGGVLTDSAVYGSPFGFGLAASLGDLLLSGLTVLASVVIVNRWLRPVRIPVLGFIRSTRIRRLLFLSGAVVTAFAFVLFVRGLAAAIRSFVVDSTLAYGDATEILPDPGLFWMFVAVVLLSLAFFGVLMLLTEALLALMRALTGRREQLAVIASVGVLTLAYGALRLMEETPLWSWYVPFIAAVIVWLTLRWEERLIGLRTDRRQYTWRTSLAWLLGAFLVTAPIFHERILERERMQVEAVAGELLRPVDSWLSFVLTDGLRTASSALLERLGSEELAGGTGVPAFELWSGSLMSRQGYNSGVVIYDASGKEVDRFVVGIGTYDQTALLGRLFDHEEESVQTVDRAGGGSSSALYGLWSTVRRSDGVVAASVALILSADASPSVMKRETDPLRSPMHGRESPAVFVTEIRDSLVVASTRLDLYPGANAPGALMEAMAQAWDRGSWISEDADGTSMRTFLVHDGTVPGRTLALSIQVLDLRWYAFAVLKLLMAFLAAAILVVLLRVVGKLRRRERFSITFGQKLFISFAVISVVPLFILGYENRAVSRARVDAALEKGLQRDLDAAERRIAMYVSDEDDFVNGVNDEFCRAVAAEYDIDFAVYRGQRLLASTRPELFRASLFDRRLEGLAYSDAMLLGKAFVVLPQTIGAVPYAVGYKPIVISGQRLGVVAIPTIYRQRDVDEEIGERNVGVFGGYALVLVAALAAGGLFASRFAGPVRELSEAARQVGRGRFDVALTYRGSDEIGELTTAFKDMTAELQRSRGELARVEREGAWREMAKQVAHEIRNPLTPMKLSVQHLRQAFRDGARDREQVLQRVTQTVLEQIETLSRIAAEFSHFARMPDARYERLDVRTLLEEAVAVFAEVGGIRFVRHLSAGEAAVLADHDQLRRVFINMIRNSIQAMPRGGTITIETAVLERVCQIRLSDSGPGIPADLRTRIFEPNFSTKSEGMGLGLAIAKKVIEESGGTISCESVLGEGTTFEIRIPLAAGGIS